MNITILFLCIIGVDFPICDYTQSQYMPCTYFAGDQYYVFWTDLRYYAADSEYAVFGTRVTQQGIVLDPDGKELYRNQPAYETAVAFDGTNFLVVFRDSC